MILFVSDNQIKLNDIQLHGTLQSISVSGKLIYEAKEQTASSNRVKSITGFDDSSVEISIILTDKKNISTGNIEKTDYQMLNEINNLFKKLENGSPVIYTIKNQHINARGVKKVLFSDLDSEETNAGLVCTLKFIETESITKTIQTQQNQTNIKEIKQKIDEVKKSKETLTKEQKKEINKLIDGKIKK